MRNLGITRLEYMNKINQKICRNIQKRQQNKINNALNKLKFNELAKKKKKKTNPR